MRQVVVWEGTELGHGTVEEFEKFIKDVFGVKAKFLEEVRTNPDRDEFGNNVPETGGRIDLFFEVEAPEYEGEGEVFLEFCNKRLQYGMRWWEDILGNHNGYLYSKEILEKYPPSWNLENINHPLGNMREVIEDMKMKDLLN